VKLGESTLNRFLLYMVADKYFVADTELCGGEERNTRLTYLLDLPRLLSEGRG
jgi:hypothetical protein